MISLALAAVGGALGSAARRALTMLVENGPLAPIATLPVNIAGCFAAGLVMALLSADAPQGWRWFLSAGFLGGFTTFSAFSIEVTSLIADAPLRAMAYAMATTFACVAAAMAGLWCGRLLSP